MPPTTRYARSRDARIAFQVHGDGPVDVVLVPAFVSNVDFLWQMPAVPRIFDWIATYARLIIYDKRGTGLSDPARTPPSLDQRVEDLRAVMDAAGSGSAVVLGLSEGGPASMLFAATHPDRVEKLILYGTSARFSHAADWPHGVPAVQLETLAQYMSSRWGDAQTLALWAPGDSDDPALGEAWSGYLRTGATAQMGHDVLKGLVGVDARHAAPQVEAPTLMLHRTGDRMVSVGGARATADLIRDVRWHEFPGDDHLPFAGDWRAIFSEVEAFVTGAPAAAVPTTEFLTILAVPGREPRAVDEITRHRGRVVEVADDVAIAAFDGPTPALRAARAILGDGAGRGIPLRAGVHTGMCDVFGDDVHGLAVEVCARICAAADENEILVSSTVRELLAGTRPAFVDRGEHDLAGVPGTWRLHAVRE